jgi:ribosomal protein L37AE/L43A
MNNQTIDINTEYEVNQDYGDYTKCPDCEEYSIMEKSTAIGNNDWARLWECVKCGATYSE